MDQSAQPFSFLPRNRSCSISRMVVIVDEDDEDIGCPSSPSSSESSAGSSPTSPAGADSGGSSSDLTDDASSSSASLLTHSSDGSPLYQMSELIQDLPVKRGLSRHFNGKSQSFTSLANVRCLQDLVKPMRKPPPSKAMRPCRSYAAGLDGTNNNNSLHHHHQLGNPHSPKGSIAKRPVRNSSAGLFHHAPRPPMHPHSSGNLAGQALLFA